MKAQAISMDFFFAVMILMIIIATLTIILFDFVSFQEQRAENRDMQIKGQEAINALIMTPGSSIEENGEG